MPQRDSAYWAELGAKISAQLQAVAEKKPAHVILGVSSKASVQAVHSAFDAWVKRIHLDRLTGAPKKLVDDARQLLIALAEARVFLLDQGKRQAQAQATAVESAAERAKEAEQEYLQGKLALDANRLEEAEACLRRAVSMEPQNGLYLAELVWVQFLCTPEAQRVRRLPQFIGEMERATQLSPKSARVAHLTGKLFQAQGNMLAAEQAFEAAVRFGSREAASELRLLAIRRKTGTYPKAPLTAPLQRAVPRGFLGRIFPGRGKPNSE